MTEHVVEVNDNDFYNAIKKDKLVLVDFWAGWCGPCQMMAPTIEEVAKEFLDKVKIIKLNVDNSPSIATDFNVMNIPTLIFFKDGQDVDRIVGVASKRDLSHKIKELI